MNKSTVKDHSVKPIIESSLPNTESSRHEHLGCVAMIAAAVQWGASELFELVFSSPWAQQVSLKEWMPALKACVRFSRADFLQKILESKKGWAKEFEVNEEIDNLICEAVDLGAIECLEFLVKAGASLNRPDFLGRLALSLAAVSNEVEGCETLIKLGAWVDGVGAKVLNGVVEAPLLCAAREGAAECVSLLLKHGANPNQCGDANRGALSILAESAGEDGDVVLEKTSIKIVEALVAAGAQVDALDDYGLTALHIACTNNFKTMVQALLKCGADPWLPVREQGNDEVLAEENAMDVALRYGSKESCFVLLEWMKPENKQAWDVLAAGAYEVEMMDLYQKIKTLREAWVLEHRITPPKKEAGHLVRRLKSI